MAQEDQKPPTSKPGQMVWGKETPAKEIVAALRKKFPPKEEEQPDPDET